MNVSTKSDFNVEVVRITDVQPHPNADRLDCLTTTAGYPVLDVKGKYRVGDLAVYVPVDAIVPLSNPAFAFLATKPGQETARINARRLRGVYSEGLLISAVGLTRTGGPIQVGDNVQEALGIRKAHSAADLQEHFVFTERKHTTKAPKGMPVYGLDSLHRFADAISLGTPVVITEKIHGCNARYRFENGRLFVGSHKVMRGDSGSPFKNKVSALVRYVKGLFRKTRPNGGNNPDVSHGDIWWTIARQYDLAGRLSKYEGLTFYGEIYGKGLQVRGDVDFVYDSPDGLKFRVFDIWDDSKKAFLSEQDMTAVCTDVVLPMVPELYRGAWLGVEKTNERLAFTTNSNAFPWTYFGGVVVGYGPHIREGWVVRTDVDIADPNRKIFKYVSPEYKLLGAKENR